MNKLEKRLILIVAIFSIIVSVLLTISIYAQSAEIHHLESENAKFKQEIEYFKGSNELLQEDNVKFQDALWHYHDNKMKEGAK